MSSESVIYNCCYLKNPTYLCFLNYPLDDSDVLSRWFMFRKPFSGDQEWVAMDSVTAIDTGALEFKSLGPVQLLW